MKQTLETLISVETKEQLGYYISFNTINTIQYDKTSDSHKFLNLNNENIKTIYKNTKIFFRQSQKDHATTTFTDTIFIYFFLNLVQSLKKKS